MHDSWLVSQIKIELPIKNRKILLAFASSDNQNVGDFVGDMSETKLTERQQKILNLIKESPTISAKQMSETLSVTTRTIERDLSLMKKAGVLTREGKDNDGVWVIIV
jgi:ATP-dependent DNA helicase RecG